MSRKYTKGRDFFDLGWYLSRWKGLIPNMKLLQNALKQTGWKKAMPSEHTWVKDVMGVVRDADWRDVRKDVENFLENQADLEIFSKDNIILLLEGK